MGHYDFVCPYFGFGETAPDVGEVEEVADWVVSVGRPGRTPSWHCDLLQDAYRSVITLYAISALFLFNRGSSRISESPAPPSHPQRPVRELSDPVPYLRRRSSLLVDSAPQITPLILQIATFDADRMQDGGLLRVIRHQIPNYEHRYQSAGNFRNPPKIFGKQIQEGGDASSRRNQQREPKSLVVAPVPVGERGVASPQPRGIQEALPYLVPGLPR